MRKNNIRKTKTDKVDTYILAKTLMTQPHRFMTQEDLDRMRLNVARLFNLTADDNLAPN